MRVSNFLGGEVKGDVGIEIEVEGANLPQGTGLWIRERDGSLRGEEAAEYVLHHPINIGDVKKELNHLKEAFVKKNSRYDNSPRAGVHVHINVNDLDFKEVITMICMYIILEELFIKFCDKTREGNLFCLSSYDAEHLVMKLVEACETDNIRTLDNDHLRYSSLNIRSLFKYGSIEFRSLESTKDFDKVELWCQMLYKLKASAKEFGNPEELMRSFSMHDYMAMLDTIMGPYAHHLTRGILDPRKIIRKGVLRAQDIAFCRNWKNTNLNIFSKNKGVFS